MGQVKDSVRVWDLLVRLSHWFLAVMFFVAYFTEDELLSVHVWAGYAVGVIIVLRVLWGFIGPKHARFSDFPFGPWKVWKYFLDLVQFRSRRYIGHSPAGGAMIMVLMVFLGLVVWSGLKTYAIEENAGPLAFSLTTTVGDNQVAGASKSGSGGDWWEDFHELISNLTLGLVILYILGVLLASFAHGENLAWSMITWRKRPNE